MAVASGQRIGREDVIWAFGPELEPVLEIEPGETVTFETNDCFTGQIRSEDDLVTEIDLERINGATGPVAVRGAEPGDSLVAEEAARLLVDQHGFSPEDAFIFLSVACDAGVAQACKPAPGGFGTIARFAIPKIEACPAPFRS